MIYVHIIHTNIVNVCASTLCTFQLPRLYHSYVNFVPFCIRDYRGVHTEMIHTDTYGYIQIFTPYGNGVHIIQTPIICIRIRM